MATYGLDADRARKSVEEVRSIIPILDKYWNTRAGSLSGGERQMLAMAIALIRKPKAILFDEPTGNLSPKMAIQIFEIIKRLRDEFAITIIIAEQNARKALELGDTAFLMVSGRPIFKGSADELLNHAELGRLYLGITLAGRPSQI
jgi:branched-chain amino acid transport system ATP-binding protein